AGAAADLHAAGADEGPVHRRHPAQDGLQADGGGGAAGADGDPGAAALPQRPGGRAVDARVGAAPGAGRPGRQDPAPQGRRRAHLRRRHRHHGSGPASRRRAARHGHGARVPTRTIIATGTIAREVRPALRTGATAPETPLSVSAIALSVVGHLALFSAAVATATVWRPEPSKVYIVNLVPAVAAVGSPSGSAHATPQAPVKSDPAPRATPAAKSPPAETPSAPTLPELPREPVRARSVHDTPALPDASGSHELALPASPARLKVPSLPSERPVVGPRDPDRTLPSRLVEIPRARPPLSGGRTSTADVLARPAPRDVPEVARSLTPPGPLPAPSAPDLARASAPALPRPATLPRVGKELPSLAAPPPEPSLLATARPAPTPPKTALPVGPPPGAVALGAPAASTQGSGPVTVEASDFPFAWYLHAVPRKITA